MELKTYQTFCSRSNQGHIGYLFKLQSFFEKKIVAVFFFLKIQHLFLEDVFSFLISKGYEKLIKQVFPALLCFQLSRNYTRISLSI